MTSAASDVAAGTAGTVGRGTVIVTGAASGIGRGVALRLGRDGRHVIAVDRTAAGLGETCLAIHEVGGSAEPVVGDVRDRDTHRRARTVAHEAGAFSAWIGCAGITRLHDLAALSEEAVREVVDVNQLGLLWGAAEAVAEWTETASTGTVVVISSIHARHAAERHPVYEMTKAAAEALVRSIAVTYGPRGIRAVAVAPGAIDTPALRQSLNSADDPAAAEHRLADFAPLERIGSPGEIGDAVAFLVSERASFITGTTLTVDGGWSAVLARDPSDAAARRRS